MRFVIRRAVGSTSHENAAVAGLDDALRRRAAEAAGVPRNGGRQRRVAQRERRDVMFFFGEVSICETVADKVTWAGGGGV